MKLIPIVYVLCVVLTATLTLAQDDSAVDKRKDSAVTARATGTFEAKLTPQAQDDK